MTMPEFDSVDAVGSATPEQLARILHANQETCSSWTEQDLPAMYRHQLSARLESAPSQSRLPQSGEHVQPSTPALTTLHDVLCCPQPPIALLRSLKDRFKAQAGPADDRDAEQMVAYLFYLLSIAAAQVKLAARITTLADVDLLRAYDWARVLPFLEQSDRTLLNEARDKLQHRCNTPG